MLDELIEKYAWVEEDLYFVWDLAIIEGKTREEVIGIYCGSPESSVGDYYFAQMFDLQGPGPPEPLRFHVQVFAHGPFVLALENNGYVGNVPEIARRCSSSGGRHFNVLWNGNGIHSIAQAVDGKVTAYFELRDGDDPYNVGDLAPPWITEGVTVDMGKLRSTQMALMEQQTGLEFDRRWLTELRPTYRIPASLLQDVDDAWKVY